MSTKASLLMSSLAEAISELRLQLEYIELNLSIVNELMKVSHYNNAEMEILQQNYKNLRSQKTEVIHTIWLHEQKLRYLQGALAVQEALTQARH